MPRHFVLYIAMQRKCGAKIRTRITYKKIPCYMHDPACSGVLLKMQKVF